MEKISRIKTRLFEVPLPEVLVDAKLPAHTRFELVTVTVTLEDGSEGTGYTYTGGKGGRENLDEDVERVRVVSDLIGKDVTLMVDANYPMKVEKPILAARRFQPFDVFWFEEPTLPDEYTTRPVVIENHRAVSPDLPGTGVEFDWHALRPFLKSESRD